MSSGLTGERRHKAVNMTLQAAILGYHHRANISYTQGAMRWEGIDKHRKAYLGEYPHTADCSAFTTWCLWQPARHFGLSDFVNGLHWQGGYTGTMANHGKRVWVPSPGDICLYGSYPYHHVTLYTGGGLCVSHGSWRGPLLLPVRYRGDFAQYRRML